MSDRRHLWYRQMSIQEKEAYNCRQDARRRMDDARMMGNFEAMRKAAIDAEIHPALWEHFVLMFEKKHGADKVPPAFQTNWNPNSFRPAGPTKVKNPAAVPVHEPAVREEPSAMASFAIGISVAVCSMYIARFF